MQKQQQGKFVSKMFEQLDELKGNDPKKYMQIVEKIRDGNIDNQNPCDSNSISPEAWRDHFSGLLGPKVGAKKNMRIILKQTLITTMQYLRYH